MGMDFGVKFSEKAAAVIVAGGVPDVTAMLRNLSIFHDQGSIFDYFDRIIDADTKEQL